MPRMNYPGFLIGILLVIPIAAMAQSVDSVFERMATAQNAKYKGIDNYTKKTSTLGLTTFEYFENTSSIALGNGQTVPVMRSVPLNEIQERRSANALSNASPEELERAANAMEQQGAAMEQGMRDEMQNAGIPAGIGQMVMNPPPGQPWLSANPRDMTNMYATMLRGAAEGKRQQANQNPEADARRLAADMEALKEQTRIAGHENFNGTDALVLVADNLNYQQTTGDASFSAKNLRMLVDANRYVPLLLTIEGDMSDGKETRAVKIEREDKDYRTAPGCGNMYEPYTTVMRISGLMSPKDQAKLGDTQAKLAELETQMASMPPGQRQMMERMMGPQLDMLRSMASGKGIEIESKVVDLRCNTGLPDPLEIAQTTFGGGMTGGGDSPGVMQDKLVQMIQVDLQKLGYHTGNTNGDLDKLTVVAISKFQADNAMAVTGQPTPQLAGILSAAVDARK